MDAHRIRIGRCSWGHGRVRAIERVAQFGGPAGAVSYPVPTNIEGSRCLSCVSPQEKSGCPSEVVGSQVRATRGTPAAGVS